jgi:hypothetical protein
MNEVVVKKKKGLPTWAIVLIALAVGAPFIIGILAAFAIYGVRKYMVQAKRHEAVAMIEQWSKGMVACAQKDGVLPPTSSPVPSTLAAVSGCKYQSASSDWLEPAFSCSAFSMSGPQYFQYQWERTSESQGVLRALSDLNGDGRAEEAVEAQVSCSGGRCLATTATP